MKFNEYVLKINENQLKFKGNIEKQYNAKKSDSSSQHAAVSAVAVTTFAQPLFNFIKKQIQTRLQNKIDKWKKKRLLKDNQKVS